MSQDSAVESHSPRTNIRDVAAQAGVSISAVSLALNGKPGVAPAKRARVLQIVQELGYQRTGNGQRAPVGTRVLGLLMESLSIPAAHDRFYAEIVAGIEEAAQRLGYRLLLHLYRPGVDPIAHLLRRFLGDRVSYPINRWKNVTLQGLTCRLARTRPRLVKKMVRRGLLQALPAGFDIDTHFKPKYNPWDQRLCLVPDSDMFLAIKEGKATVVTDEVERFTAQGIKLKSGADLPADIIVSATGLKLNCAGDVAFSIDGQPADMARTMTYKGMFFSDVPNLAVAMAERRLR